MRHKAFSPHAWGWSVIPDHEKAFPPVFPTRVGMVRLPSPFAMLAASFPHTRGDGPSSAPRPILCLWFSPHAWGWSGIARVKAKPENVFPTRVGMVRVMFARCRVRVSFPHTRGDGPG